MDTKKLVYPIVKVAINVPTAGFGGAFMESLLEIPYEEQRKKKIDDFMNKTIEDFE